MLHHLPLHVKVRWQDTYPLVQGRSHLGTCTPSAPRKEFTSRSSPLLALNQTPSAFRLYCYAGATRPLLLNTSSSILKVYIHFFFWSSYIFHLGVCNRQRWKPTPPYPGLHHSIERHPIVGHHRARPTLILDILRNITSHPSRSHRRLLRCASICGFTLSVIASDDLRPLPRRIHRCLPSGTPQRLTERRCGARPRARKCIHERARHAPRALPSTVATLPLPRPVRA